MHFLLLSTNGTDIKEEEAKCQKSKEMITKAKEIIPGGVQHNLAFNYPFPIVITKAKGAKLYDIDGNGYRELIIQTGDDGAFEIYYPLYDGDKVVGALSAGIIPGSEDGTELELYAVTNEFDLYE